MYYSTYDYIRQPQISLFFVNDIQSPDPDKKAKKSRCEAIHDLAAGIGSISCQGEWKLKREKKI